MNWDSAYKSGYIAELLNSHSWFKMAESLISAGELLEPMILETWEKLRQVHHTESDDIGNIRYLGTYFMLMAYAIENILKGMIIFNNRIGFRQYLKRTGNLPPRLKSHKLYNLAIRARIEIDEAEEDLLRRMTRSARWKGRYPVPLDYDELMGQEYSNGTFRNDSVFMSADIEKVKNFIIKLRRVEQS